jgi:hypothetical protein
LSDEQCRHEKIFENAHWITHENDQRKDFRIRNTTVIWAGASFQCGATADAVQNPVIKQYDTQDGDSVLDCRELNNTDQILTGDRAMIHHLPAVEFEEVPRRGTCPRYS